MTAAFDTVLQLAEQLDPAEQEMLIQQLRSARRTPPAHEIVGRLQAMRLNLNPTREDVIAELDLMWQLPVKPENRLLGKYASHSMPPVSAAELQADVQAVATEWEQELDEFYTDKP